MLGGRSIYDAMTTFLAFSSVCWQTVDSYEIKMMLPPSQLTVGLRIHRQGVHQKRGSIAFAVSSSQLSDVPEPPNLRPPKSSLHSFDSTEEHDESIAAEKDLSPKGINEVTLSNSRGPSFTIHHTKLAAFRLNSSVTGGALLRMSLLAFLVWRAGKTNLLPTALTTSQQALVWYARALDVYPIITKSISAGVVGFMGDYIAQKMEHGLFSKKKIEMVLSNVATSTTDKAFKPALPGWLSIDGNYNLRRGVSNLIFGVLLSGPIMHVGYDLFERILPIAGGGGTLAALCHVVADNLLLDSAFVAAKIWVLGVMEGYSLPDVSRQFNTDFIPALKAGWATSFIVMPIQLACFRYLPLSFRVLSVNVLGIIWDTVISLMTHRSRHREGNEEHTLNEENKLVNP